MHRAMASLESLLVQTGPCWRSSLLSEDLDASPREYYL